MASAQRTLIPEQKTVFAATAVFLAALGFAVPAATLAGLTSIALGAAFTALVAMRVISLLAPGIEDKASPLPDAQLPVYTVLVPLYRETAALPGLIRAIETLDYPALGSKSTRKMTDKSALYHYDSPLDEGIRPYVELLQANGFETVESCQGGEGHAYADPTVAFKGGAYEGYRAFAVAMEHGLPVMELQSVYDVVDGRLEGPYWQMVFKQAA